MNRCLDLALETVGVAEDRKVSCEYVPSVVDGCGEAGGWKKDEPGVQDDELFLEGKLATVSPLAAMNTISVKDTPQLKETSNRGVPSAVRTIHS